MVSRIGKRFAVRLHPHPVAAEHVGAVGEEGDAAEALGLALGAQHPARRVEAHQLAVGGGVELDLGFDQRAVAGDLDDQRRPVHPPLGVPAVDRDPQRRQLVAVEPQRAVVVAVALDAEPGADPRRLGIEVEVELDLGHQPVGRAVILAPGLGMLRGGRGLGGNADIGHGR